MGAVETRNMESEYQYLDQRAYRDSADSERFRA